jgi:D-lactate dehydrogenase
MKISVFSSRRYEKSYLETANAEKHELVFIDTYLNIQTAFLAKDSDAVIIFVNDDASAPVLNLLHQLGVRFVALRSAGFNHVDLDHAAKLGLRVGNVPEYSPYAVAEHTVALMLALNRKLIKANQRVHDLNFSLDGLIGFDMFDKKVGIIGLGKIGLLVAKILHGFGCQLLVYDIAQDSQLAEQYGLQYVDLETLVQQSDIISLHVPLNSHTKYLINEKRVHQMKRGVMLINTSRGGLVDTAAVIEGIKEGIIGYLGLDVYEEEQGIFFEDHSEDILQDDVLARLLVFPNVLVTSHQAFLTKTALTNIAYVTFENLNAWEKGEIAKNELTKK